MKIEVQARPPGTRRSYVDFHPYRIALPLSLSLSSSYFPTEQSTTDIGDGSWQCQRVVNLTVLLFTLRVVVRGPLFTAEEID